MTSSTPNSNPTPPGSQPQTNATTNTPSSSSQKLKGILVIGATVAISVITLAANMSQIGDSILNFCKNYSVAPMEGLCRQIEAFVPSRKIPETNEKLPKFVRSQPTEQPEPKFKRSS